MQAFIELLKAEEPDLLFVALEALECVLQCGISEENENSLADEFEAKGGLSTLESLQLHKSADVYHKAIHLIERFFQNKDNNAAMS